MDKILQSILHSGSVVAKDGTNHALGNHHIPEDEGEFLQTMIKGTQPKVSLEVGCAYGISSLYICEALREVNATKHIIIDVYQHDGFAGIGLLNLQRAGYGDLIEFHSTFSYKALPFLIEGAVAIDFAFIDGEHTFDYGLVDFFFVDKLLRPGGIVVLDDLTYPSIRSVCRYVLLNLPYKCVGPPSRLSALQKLAARVSAGTPLRRVLKPRISVPDGLLNLPNARYVALKKLKDDRIGEGKGATRHHSTHRPF